MNINNPMEPPCSGMGCAPGSSPISTGIPSIEELAGYNKNVMPGAQRNMPRTMQRNAPQPPWIPGTRSAITEMPGSLSPITPTTQPMPVSAESLQYMNGFLRTQIGRPVRVEFLIGTNNMVDRTGILIGVGANYILLNETETDDILLCDFYNIKFIRFYY